MKKESKYASFSKIKNICFVFPLIILACIFNSNFPFSDTPRETEDRCEIQDAEGETVGTALSCLFKSIFRDVDMTPIRSPAKQGE